MKITVAFRKFAKAPEMAALLMGRLHSILFRRHLSKNDSVQHRLPKNPLAQEIELVPPISYPFRCCLYAFQEAV
jgi:hypothetical protein